MKMKKKYMGGGMNKPRMTYRMGGLSKAQSREMDQDNDGDIDGQDLAMLRKAKHGMKMEYGHGGKNEYDHGGKNKMYSMEHGGETMKRTGFMEMGSKTPKFEMGEDDTMDALIIMQDGGMMDSQDKEKAQELQMFSSQMKNFAEEYPNEFQMMIKEMMKDMDKDEQMGGM
tara:strand:+ start:913 stop:1422 length:510 start_codon:yes stop_codon:yes gene_type:complete